MFKLCFGLHRLLRETFLLFSFHFFLAREPNPEGKIKYKKFAWFSFFSLFIFLNIKNLKWSFSSANTSGKTQRAGQTAHCSSHHNDISPTDSKGREINFQNGFQMSRGQTGTQAEAAASSHPAALPPPTSPEAPLGSAQTQHSLLLHKQVVFPENYINNGMGSGNGLTQLRDLGPNGVTWVLVTKQNIGAYKHPKSVCVSLCLCVCVCGPPVNDHHISIQNLIACLRSTLKETQHHQQEEEVSSKWERRRAGQEKQKKHLKNKIQRLFFFRQLTFNWKKWSQVQHFTIKPHSTWIRIIFLFKRHCKRRKSEFVPHLTNVQISCWLLQVLVKMWKALQRSPQCRRSTGKYFKEKQTAKCRQSEKTRNKINNVTFSLWWAAAIINHKNGLGGNKIYLFFLVPFSDFLIYLLLNHNQHPGCGKEGGIWNILLHAKWQHLHIASKLQPPQLKTGCKNRLNMQYP